MKIKYNAELIVKNHLKKDNIVATRKALENNVNHSYKHKFFQELQIYITKIGLVLSDCLEDTKIKNNTYLGSIEFICKRIIKKEQLYSVMRAISINDAGNQMKHSINDISGDIEFTLKQYNNMISELVKTTNIQAFKQCYLNKKQNVRDVAFNTELKHHKYFIIKDMYNNKDVKIQAKINPLYEYDQYSKTAKSKITLFWPEGNPGYYINVSVVNTKNKKTMVTAKEVSIGKSEEKVALNFTFNENDLSRRVISVDVKVDLLINKEHYYSTGILFWKDYHSYYTKENVTTHTEHLTQLYAEERKK